MTQNLDPVMTRVARQRERLPGMYGQVDFSRMPERFAAEPEARSALRDDRSHRRAELMANPVLVERIRAYTLLGDQVADAYAALIPQYGFKRLVAMLVEACDNGVEAVAGAPVELVEFIRAMERVPDWVDMRLVEQGATLSRNAMVHLAPLVLRGAFFATFLNKYSALPMAMTGALSNETAARRILETANFFTVTALPGGMHRYGPGFKAAAMVRLMHSMVRFHALNRPGHWDVTVYGIPIPQVDQMPAGLIGPYLAALQTLRRGHSEFSPEDRARVEFARYRCFLLGLPEDLLPDTAQGMADVMETRAATLRFGFEDATCGALLRATLAADLGHDPGLLGRLRARVEPSFARVFFVRNFLAGDRERAARIGIAVTARDRLLFVAGFALSVLPMALYGITGRIPGLRGAVDRRLVRKLEGLLRRYGHAEFTTDATHYTRKKAA